VKKYKLWKQRRATQTRAKTDTTATTRRKTTTKATTTRATTSKNGGEKVAYHCGEKNTNCGFCVSKLESTTASMLYSHIGLYSFTSIQTNLGQIYLHHLE
jgi:hypothetical protein